jgi:catechol 2,3-dioxygenase-like lactoylglutathione lyase family enzyme
LASELNQREIIAFVQIANVDGAREFYRNTLGLRLVADELPYSLVFAANASMPAKVAWFKDPGGNVLSVSQFPASHKS